MRGWGNLKGGYYFGGSCFSHHRYYKLQTIMHVRRDGQIDFGGGNCFVSTKWTVIMSRGYGTTILWTFFFFFFSWNPSPIYFLAAWSDEKRRMILPPIPCKFLEDYKQMATHINAIKQPLANSFTIPFSTLSGIDKSDWVYIYTFIYNHITLLLWE